VAYDFYVSAIQQDNLCPYGTWIPLEVRSIVIKDKISHSYKPILDKRQGYFIQNWFIINLQPAIYQAVPPAK